MRVLALLLLIGAVAIGVLSATDIDDSQKDKQVSQKRIEKTEENSSTPRVYERKW